MHDEEELPPSKLGTKAHWDMVYERENRVFDDVGDEGEVWFGEDAVTKMRAWAHANLEPSATPLRVLECGSGNGTLLLSFLTWPGPEPQAFHLTGIDYSSGAAKLGASVEAARREAIEEEDEDVLDPEDVVNPVTCEWRVGDLLHDDIPEQWDLVMDKGTFDALALSQDPVAEKGGRLPSRVYPEQVAKLVKPGGFFLITSCNFTEEEIRRRYTEPGLGFTFHVPHPSFSFGGKTGQTVCTVAFKKEGTESLPSAAAVASFTVTPGTPLYVCVDCGGTKTEVAIASPDGIITTALGPTSNMAEVGLQQAYRILVETMHKATAAIGHASSDPAKCAVEFADIWVGISGCDTPLDQKRMSELLSPFFGKHVPVHNDALLLGGALLTNQSPWGIALIAGTGSIAVALEVGADGEVAQVARRGGHGYLLGDDGSAWDVGRCAVRAAVDAFDAWEEETPLLRKMCEHFDVANAGEMLGRVHEVDSSLPAIDAANAQKLRVTSLARTVLESLAEGDALAVTAVRNAATPLANSAVALVRQLENRPLPDGSRRTLARATLVCGGGCIRQEAYRAVVLDLCRAQGVEFGSVTVVSDVAGEGVLGLVNKAKQLGQAGAANVNSHPNGH